MASSCLRSSPSQNEMAMPVGAGAAGAADAMHVGFGYVGQFVVHHVADAVDVDAARGDIGGDQDAYLAAAERREHALALAAGSCCRGSLRPRCRPCTSRRATRSAPCLVRVKTSARSTGFLPQQIDQERRLVRRGRRGRRDCSIRSAVAAAGVTATLRRIAQHVRRPARRSRPAWWPRTTASAGSPAAWRRSCGCRAMKPMSSMRSASSSTKISMPSKVDEALLHQVQQAARRGDEDIDAVLQRSHLRALIHAAEDADMPQAGVPAVGGEAGADLRGELASRAKHQGAGSSCRGRAADCPCAVSRARSAARTRRFCRCRSGHNPKGRGPRRRAEWLELGWGWGRSNLQQ